MHQEVTLAFRKAVGGFTKDTGKTTAFVPKISGFLSFHSKGIDILEYYDYLYDKEKNFVHARRTIFYNCIRTFF